MTNEIQWKDGAVCYAGKEQWFTHNGEYFTEKCLSNSNLVTVRSLAAHLDWLVGRADFQLNHIRTGDFIAASELDTEQKYNDVVEVFGLFGFPEFFANAGFNCLHKFRGLGIVDGEVMNADHPKRQLTYQQIMTIGKLKRMSDEKKTSNAVSTVNRDIERNIKDGDKYHREIVGLDGTKTTVDVYRVLDAFPTNCAATDHAIKKMLCAGLRGHKDKITDIDNAIESLQAAKKLIIQKGARQ